MGHTRRWAGIATILDLRSVVTGSQPLMLEDLHAAFWIISKEPSGPRRRGAGSPGKRQPDEQHPGRGSFELLCPPRWHRCECRPTAAHVQRACGGGPAAWSCSHTSRSPRPPAAPPCLAQSFQPGLSQARYGRPVSVQKKKKEKKRGKWLSERMSEWILRLFSITKSEKSKICSPLPTSHKASPPIPERLKTHLLSFAHHSLSK